MKTIKKKLDCVRLKDQVQAALLKEYAGLSDDQVRRRVLLKLARSRSAVAGLWRTLRRDISEQPRSSRRGSRVALGGPE